ncbi:dihydroorotase [Iodobacter fluviatilis]|uniref:Dihydroorotase n=1 Tax=Iodobacter fluviatilis TaxID=537 RepID=A0A377SV31_9NEIS|nr:dihydroorotase [Iodobacter fluviatilis]TCU83392.1 dihydroorotase [Iodobacter fluviatilis]STR45891.1 Dihydroorotase [Iodobacter fluviatilis]
MKNIAILGGRLIDPLNNTDQHADLYLAGGKIVGVGSAPAGFVIDETINASGLLVSPGLVDLAARLREPGFEYKATLASEMAAAVAGGVTSIMCPPDTDPPLDEPSLVTMLRQRAKNLDLARLYPVGALSRQLKGKELTEMAELRDAGCVAFSQGDQAVGDLQILYRAMQYAATFDVALRLLPQEADLNSGVAHDGDYATRMGLVGIPVLAETVAISNILLLMKETGARVHLCRLSSMAGLDLVRTAKKQGLPVTCDVSINHIHLADVDIGFFDSNFRFDPPLRSVRDRDAIVAALADGTIDAICSDHSPVDDDGKLLPFAEAESGATGLELLLPLTLAWAERQHVSLPQALAKITAVPAKMLGFAAGLEVGHRADLVIFDPEAHWQVTPAALKSQGKNTPFVGLEMKGRVVHTLVKGKRVYQLAD